MQKCSLVSTAAADLWFTSVRSICHAKLSSSTRTSLGNRLWSERLCMNYFMNYFNLLKFSKIAIIYGLPEDNKMTSLRIFISPVM